MRHLSLCLLLAGIGLLPGIVAAQLPDEPLQIERGVLQFVHDSYLIDNHWAIRYKRQAVTLVHHPPRKHPQSPFAEFTADLPSYVSVVLDRRPVEGFDHADSRIGSDGDETRRTVTWHDAASLDRLTGETIRLEVFLKNVDLFSWGASEAAKHSR